MSVRSAPAGRARKSGVGPGGSGGGRWPRMSGGRWVVGGASLAAVGGYGILGQWINPAVQVAVPLRLDLLALALMGWLWLLGRWGRATGLPILVGGLLGAALVSPWAVLPWLVFPAGALGWVGRGGRRTASVATVAVLAFAGNAALLTGFSSRGLRISAPELEAMDLRANRLLSDVPVHDAWAIELRGRTAPTLDDLIHVFRSGSPLQATPAVLCLGMLRGAVGVVFGWEDPRWTDVASSFLSRVTEDDRNLSVAAPGKVLGIWRVLYAFSREAAVETLNGTAHVAVVAALEDGGNLTRLVLSFRVREVNWTTRFYMRVIDPARRFFVYPSLLRQFAHTWNREGWDTPGLRMDGEDPGSLASMPNRSGFGSPSEPRKGEGQ